MLTLQELKQISGMPECNAKLPTAKQLRESGVVIAKEKIGVDTEILAYRNGYALYCVGNHATVFPVYSCGDYLYLEGGNAVRLSEQFFCGKEWYLRLVLEGEDRLSRNHEAKEQSRSVSYHAISEDWTGMEDQAKSALLNMDDNGPSEALGMDEGIPDVADCPRKAVNLAGRVSDASRIADGVRKPSVLDKLKQAKERVTAGRGNQQKLGRKKEQEL